MDQSKRSLIFLWPYIEWGGPQIYFSAIIRLARENWDVTAIFPKNSSQELIELIRSLGINIIGLEAALDIGPADTIGRKLLRRYRQIRVEIESYWKLRSFRLRDAVVHAEFGPWQSWFFFTILSLHGTNSFVTLNNPVFVHQRWRWFLFQIKMHYVSRLPRFHIFASNKEIRNFLSGLVSAKFWQSIPVTYAGIDRTLIESIEIGRSEKKRLRNAFQIPENQFVVLTVGRFIDRKGRWILLDAAKRARSVEEGIVFVWVAPSMPTEEDSYKIISFQLGENFKMILSADLGGDRRDVLNFFQMADCFALPSFVEGLPISILEAMGLGVPVVSTNVFAIPEAIKHEKTGLLIEPGDSEDLSRSILRLKKDRGLSRRISQDARKYVLENFDSAESSRTAVQCYERCFADG